MSHLVAIRALWRRELVKFVRDRSRLIGALAQPIGFWLLLGLGFQGTFRLPDEANASVPYMEYLFPGIITLILLFTAVFTSISIVEERRSGFLQAFLIAPVPRTTLVIGNTMGGTTLATVQAMLFWLLAPVVGLPLQLPGLVIAMLVSILTGLAFTAMGLAIAWRMDSTRGFHAVMNLFLLPLWFLSGAAFPADGASPLLAAIMTVNPVSYAVSALRAALYWPETAPAVMASLPVSLGVSAAFAFLMLVGASLAVRRPVHAAP